MQKMRKEGRKGREMKGEKKRQGLWGERQKGRALPLAGTLELISFCRIGNWKVEA